MWTISVSWCCCQLLLLLRGELEKRSPGSWQELEWGLSTKLATGGRPPPPAVHRAPANFQPMWPRSHPRQFELILCMKFGGRQCQMFNWNQDANFPSSTRFVNPVKNKIKAIKLIWQHLSFMQATHGSWFPILCLPLPTPSICSVIFMVPQLAQHTVSSTDSAKSKIPFRDLFYLKSIPLMGLMAFQSLSMHCQWGRIGFLRIPVLGGKQTAFLPVAIWPMNRCRTPPSWVHKLPPCSLLVCEAATSPAQHWIRLAPFFPALHFSFGLYLLGHGETLHINSWWGWPMLSQQTHSWVLFGELLSHYLKA